MTLDKKKILVVGGATGIGRATAIVCAQRGAEVIIGDLDVVEGNATAEACNGFFIELDVTNESNVMDMCESIGRRYLRMVWCKPPVY